MVFKIASVVKRNFLIFYHSKLSSLILILGPILLMLIIGTGLSDTGLRNIQTSVYVSNESGFTENFIGELRANSFLVEKSLSVDRCVQSVRDGDKNLCVSLIKSEQEVPKEMEITESELDQSGIGYSVFLYVDFSKQRIVWGIINKVQRIILKFSRGLQEEASLRLQNKIKYYGTEIKSKRQELAKTYDFLNDVDKDLSYSKEQINYQKRTINPLIENIKKESGPLILASGESGETFEVLLDDLQTASNLLYTNVDGKLEDIEIGVTNSRKIVVSTDEDLDKIENDLLNLGRISLDAVLSPIPLSYESISDNLEKEVKVSLGFVDYLFPSFLSFFILAISLIFSTILIINERKSTANIRNALSETSTLSFLIGNFLTVAFIVFVQAVMIILIATRYLNLDLSLFIPELITLILISSSLFILLGMCIGYLFRSQETAIIAGISIILISIIFSSLISPLETMPELLRVILQYTPVVLMEDILRRILIFEVNSRGNIIQFIILGVMTLILFIIAIVLAYVKKYKE